jgi:hypothetical protein
MNTVTVVLIGISLLSGTACFLIGALWGRHIAHKEHLGWRIENAWNSNKFDDDRKF